MSIVGQVNIQSRRYSGWNDARYPIGYWQGALIVVGDATGGLLSVDLVFQQANGPARLNSQMYSVERFGATASSVIDKVVRIAVLNMSGPSNLGFQHSYSIRMPGQNGLSAAATDADSQNILPWFLGSQRNAGTTTSLSLVAQNIDGVSVRFEAEGYRWSPRSVLIDGGPQRPPTGPYGL